MKQILLLGLLTMILVHGCVVEPPNYPIEPVIEFVEISRTTVTAQTIPPDYDRELDSLYITISFTDGDGDFGGENTSNVFLTDSRLGTISHDYWINEVPFIDTGDGISGEIKIVVPEIYCFPNAAPRDTLIYTIQIEDRAGHLSNEIQTPPIELICD